MKLYAFISTAVMYANYGHACMYAVLACTKQQHAQRVCKCTFMYTKKMQTNFQFFKAWWICTIHPLWLFYQQCNAWCIQKKKQFFAKGLILIPIKRRNSFLIWFRCCEPWPSHMQQKYLDFCLLPSFHQYFQHSIWIMSILLVWC